MTRLYLVRHGEVEARRTFYGHLDVPLSTEGREQMLCAAEALAGLEPAVVCSSDLQRAVGGAQLIAERHGLMPRLDPAFREMHLGIVEGLSWIEVKERHPELGAKRYRDMHSYRFPGGENLQDVAARAMPALQRLLGEHAGRTVILVAHNSVNRIILGEALGLEPHRIFDFEQDFGCINWIQIEAERRRVGLINWTPGAPGTVNRAHDRPQAETARSPR
jgi:broad specificity phosphatase PhoE